MRLTATLLTLLMLLLVATAPPPALALDCVDPWSRIESYDVIVQAKVISINGLQVNLEVERYYKGTGPARLVTRFEGYGPDKRQWLNRPEKGRTYLFGFITREGALVNMACDLFGPADGQGAERLGPGSPPDPTAKPAPEQGFTWLPYGLMAGAGLIGLLLWLRRKRS